MVIRLFCAAGMSTSLLVKKMEEAAKEKGKDADILILDQDLNIRAVWAMGKLVEGTCTL